MDPETHDDESQAGTVDAEAIVLLDNDGNPIDALIHLPESVEEITPSSDAVAIAEIEANEAITIAAIQTDATVAAIESAEAIELARIEAENERELSWQNEAAELRTNIAALETRVTDLLSALANPSHPTPQPELLPQTDPATLTPEFTLDPTPEMQTEVTPNDGGESLEVVTEVLAVPVKRKRRLI